VNFGWARERRGLARAAMETDAGEMFPPFIEANWRFGEERCALRSSR
jgi:hypothetical protein